MMETTIHVSSSLEARRAALFVQTASKFSSSLYVHLDDKVVNAKSIMGIMSLGLMDGQCIILKADGSDEKVATEELERFLGTL